ncbi:MAG: glycogen/starch/alpha-glucan phosphorylase [Nitrospirota bacterium]|nr:glycogen/starch/alpha-glucan phosphorylase [Nitrospirota bacterium]
MTGAGQALIQEWIQFIRQSETRFHVMFLSDYDMRLAEHLEPGGGRLTERATAALGACGTSGMKVLVNGGLNLSELDGWWAEAYTPDVG